MFYHLKIFLRNMRRNVTYSGIKHCGLGNRHYRYRNMNNSGSDTHSITFFYHIGKDSDFLCNFVELNL